MDEIDTTAAMSAVRDAAGCASDDERQKHEDCMVGRVQQCHRLLASEDAKSTVKKLCGEDVEWGGAK